MGKVSKRWRTIGGVERYIERQPKKLRRFLQPVRAMGGFWRVGFKR